MHLVGKKIFLLDSTHPRQNRAQIYVFRHRDRGHGQWFCLILADMRKVVKLEFTHKCFIGRNKCLNKGKKMLYKTEDQMHYMTLPPFLWIQIMIYCLSRGHLGVVCYKHFNNQKLFRFVQQLGNIL